MWVFFFYFRKKMTWSCLWVEGKKPSRGELMKQDKEFMRENLTIDKGEGVSFMKEEKNPSLSELGKKKLKIL